jgi:triphosphoribosyl-dephospho-CoA synthetase
MRLIDPHELQRQVELAFFLEATIPKEQCTSRYKDIGPKQRYEDFVISAINGGRYFFALAERMNKDQGQPRTFYDLAYKALIDSQRQRSGKIVNYGLLEVMFPVAVARYICDEDVHALLGSVPQVLQATSEEDVRYVAAMRKTIFSRSDKQFKRDFPFHEEGSNVFEHYRHHQAVAYEASRLFVGELIDGMPLTKIIYDQLTQPGKCLTDRVNEGFNKARSLSKLPYGALADFTAAALFLHIASRPEGIVF